VVKQEEERSNYFAHGLKRYLRPEQIDAIIKVKIGIAGAGGLGSNCAQLLARCGFRRFVIVDYDAVDASNLNRQFFFSGQVGQPKVAALTENLRRINPEVAVEAVEERVRPDNAARLFADCDVVVEAFDRAEDKKMLVEAYVGSGKLVVAASGLAGWGDSDRITVRRISERFYVVGDGTSGISPDLPPLAPCVAIAAAKQADIVLSYVLSKVSRGESDDA